MSAPMRSLVGVLILVASVSPYAAGQQSQRPLRIDPLTASISGRVTAADSGTPIRRVEVRAIGESGISRLATTDGAGWFELRDMPAGRYRLAVSKSGFVPLDYGQRRPFEAATSIELAEGQAFTANMALPRGGAIVGRVYDDIGEPLVDVRVQALRSRMVEGRRRLQPAGPVDVTDDTGAYRLYGLPPGDYYVSATPTPVRPDLPAGAPLVAPRPPTGVRSTITTLYPGTSNLDEAQHVTLGVGGEVPADVLIAPQRTATVSGVVISSTGAPAANAQVSLQSQTLALGAAAMPPGTPPLSLGTRAGPDGTFVLPGVPPGSYVLQVTARSDTLIGIDQIREAAARAAIEGPMNPEMAFLPIIVAGADISDVTVATRRGALIEGTFAADTGVTQPLPSGLGVRVRTTSPGGPSLMHQPGNNTFRLVGINAPMHLVVENLPDTWAVKAILVNGVDTIDRPIDPGGGGTIDVRIVLTDRITNVIGTVADNVLGGQRSEPASYSVVVFPQDAAKWTYPSRYLRTVRSDERGAFRIRGLPGNERYLAVAVDYLEEGEGEDPEFLDRMRAQATGFVLGEAEQRSLNLRLIRR